MQSEGGSRRMHGNRAACMCSPCRISVPQQSFAAKRCDGEGESTAKNPPDPTVDPVFLLGELLTSTTSLVGFISCPVILHRTLPESRSSRSWCASIKLFHNSLGGCDMVTSGSRKQDEKKARHWQAFQHAVFSQGGNRKAWLLSTGSSVIHTASWIRNFRMCSGQWKYGLASNDG